MQDGDSGEPLSRAGKEVRLLQEEHQRTAHCTTYTTAEGWPVLGDRRDTLGVIGKGEEEKLYKESIREKEKCEENENRKTCIIIDRQGEEKHKRKENKGKENIKTCTMRES